MRRIRAFYPVLIVFTFFWLISSGHVVEAVMVCGDGSCDYVESVENCPVDCAALACESDEDCAEGESCGVGTCMSDCPQITFEGPCGEMMTFGLMKNSTNFFQNGTTGVCTDGIYQISVYQACYPLGSGCGDGYCISGEENCSNCPEDCNVCSEVEPANILNPEPWTGTPRMIVCQSNDTQPECQGREGTRFLYYPGVIETSEVTFEWSSGNLGNAYELKVGTCNDYPVCMEDIYSGFHSDTIIHIPEEKDPYDFPNEGPRSHTVYNIPLNGEFIYVRLTTLGIRMRPHIEIYRYKTINENPHVVPEPSTLLNRKNQPFSCGGLNVTDCEYYVMSRDGKDFYGSQIDSHYYSDVDLPLNGDQVLVIWKYLWQGQFRREYIVYDSIRCGDAIVGTGEQCDYGKDNELVCRPQPDGKCLYCTNECQFEGFVPSDPTVIIGPTR